MLDVGDAECLDDDPLDPDGVECLDGVEGGNSGELANLLFLGIDGRRRSLEVGGGGM